MKILLIEDDLFAIEYLEKLINTHFPNYLIVGKARSIKEASKICNAERPDLLIMEIQLKQESSFDLFEYIDSSQLNVVFTSRLPEFAFKAIKFDAVDYLLKPYGLEDLKQAIKRVEVRLKLSQIMQNNKDLLKLDRHAIGGNKIMVYGNEKMNPINIEHIVKIKSQGAYSDIYLVGNKKITSSKHLGLYERLLEDKHFVRIHDNCLVNAEQVVSYKPGINAKVILKDETSESVSKRKKRDFLTYFRA
jgi:two-component system LytT family response regulator